MDYELDDMALWERYGQRQYAYGRWDCAFGFWTSDLYGWFEFVPCWDLVDHTGSPPAQPSAPIVFEDQWGYIHPIDAHLGAVEFWEVDETAASARLAHRQLLEEYVALIPLRLRQAIALVSPYQWVCLEAAWRVPKFGEYLVDAITRFGPKFVCLCWQLADPFRRPLSWRLHVARRLTEAQPNEMLSWMLRTSVAKGAARLIAKLDQIPRDRESVRAICHLLRSQEKVDLLMGLANVPIKSLEMLHTLPGWLWTRKLTHLICSNHSNFDFRLATLVDLDTQVVSQDRRQKLCAYLETSPSFGCLIKRIDRELDEFWWAEAGPYLTPAERSTAVFPPAPLESEFLHPITSMQELQQESEDMRNCLDMFHGLIHTHKNYAFRWFEGQRLSVLLGRDDDGVWFLQDCRGEGNRLPRRRMRNRVVRELARRLGPAFCPL